MALVWAFGIGTTLDTYHLASCDHSIRLKPQKRSDAVAIAGMYENTDNRYSVEDNDVRVRVTMIDFHPFALTLTSI